MKQEGYYIPFNTKLLWHPTDPVSVFFKNDYMQVVKEANIGLCLWLALLKLEVDYAGMPWSFYLDSV